jgi:hypothetical protein
LKKLDTATGALHAKEMTGLPQQNRISTTFTRTRYRTLGIANTTNPLQLAGLNERAGADADRQ